MQHRSMCPRATASLAVVVAVLIVPQFAKAETCAEGQARVGAQLEETYHAERINGNAFDAVLEACRELNFARNRLSEWKCGHDDIPLEVRRACRELYSKIDDQLKPRCESAMAAERRAKDAYTLANRRFLRTQEEVGELCAREDAARRAARPAAPSAPVISSDIATCAEGKARIELARKNGDTQALAILITSVPMVCDREERQRRAARTGAASVPAAASSCDEAKRNFAEMQGIVADLRGAGDVARFRSALDNMNIAMASVQTECDRQDSSREASTRRQPLTKHQPSTKQARGSSQKNQRKPQPVRSAGQPQSGPSAADIAAAAAAAAVFIDALSSSSAAPQGPRAQPQRAAPQPQVRCHRRPDGRMHCGGN